MRFRSAIGAASGMLVLLGAAVPLLAAPQALGATTAVVVMTPKGATTVPQGVPFRLHAAINNSASQAAHIDVTFSVQSSAGEAVAFNRWDGAIPANGTQNLDLS
ncbi:MAG: hypothetical protein QOC87_2055, partial [Actinomycetota bacterium]|nr:hypothetical protein [Actinomycetota bacterium]